MKTNGNDNPLLVSIEKQTAWFTLNRPAKLNAMNDTMLIALNAGLRSAIDNNDIRSIVLTGAGDCFTAGRDVNNLRLIPGADGPTSIRLADGTLNATSNLMTDTVRILLSSHKPTVAAVRGFAFGGGQSFSLACDFVVAESDAKFANVEITKGFPAALNTVLLRRHLGPRKALEIALTGTPRTALEYRELGLVNRVCEPGTLHAATSEFVALLNDRAQWAVRSTKELMMAAENATLATGIELAHQLNQLLRFDNAIAQHESTRGDSKVEN